MTRRARLARVMVQPIFVIDDGDDLQELPPGQVATFTGSAWAAGAVEQIQAAIAHLQAEIDADDKLA